MFSGKLPRRDFLIGCGQAVAGALLPGPLRGDGFDEPLGTEIDFHLRPQYREQRPLDAILQKTSASLDDFVTEKYHDAIAPILANWRAKLLQSAGNANAMVQALTADFQGCSLHPASVKVLRSGAGPTVQQISFPQELTVGADAYLQELHFYFAELSQIFTADFQITGIVASDPYRLLTKVRYELVGTGNGFYREQRVGHWNLEWHSTSAAEYRLRCWRSESEVRSRAVSLTYEDHTQSAFGLNPSYSTQLVHGVDYWRTVLDGACGIDIYGHNGVSVGDIDNDGFDDVYVCQPAGLPNRLYRNLGGGTFEDITESSGVGLLENTACAIFADFDNDGLQDLLIVRANGPVLFLNQGDRQFREKPNAFQFATAAQGTFTGAAAADYDRDGWLDIYFCLYVYYQGTDQYKYPTPYYDANNGPPNFLLRNNRDGTFRDATAESGLNQNNNRYSFCCAWADINNDGWPDLYVANDFGQKNLYRNKGDGTFTDIATRSGVEDVGAGMSVCTFDYDNDGVQDLYVADMWTAAGERISSQDGFKKTSPSPVRAKYQKHAMGNSLFRNEGGGTFQDKTSEAGVGMGRWSWCSDSWDFDHDGYPDLYVTNGMISGPLREDLNSFFWRQVVANSPDTPKPAHAYEQGWSAVNELIRSDFSWSGYERNVFYANNHDGTFSDVSGALGLDFLEDGRAFALGDFDHDGRLEVLLKNRNGPQLRFLRNVMNDLPASISFRLRGTKSNCDAIGAVITIETDLGRQTRVLQTGSGFLSQHSKEIFFGLGDAKGLVRATIRWPSGLVQSLSALPRDHRILVDEGAKSVRMEPFQAALPSKAQLQRTKSIPETTETWLIAPVEAPAFSLPATDGSTRTLSSLRGKCVFLYFWARQSKQCQEGLGTLERVYLPWITQGLQLLTINLDGRNGVEDVHTLTPDRHYSFPVLLANDDTAAIYNILYRNLFDRHRDLGVPTSLLLNEAGEIVKVYRGALNPDQVQQDFRQMPRSVKERVAKALPFGISGATFQFRRNYLSLGSLYFQRGYFEQAAASFQLAIRDDQGSAEAQYGLGSAYLKQSRIAEARSCFKLAVKLNASYPDTRPNAWNNLGLLAAQEGRTEEAIGLFQEALRVDADYSIALLNLGNAYRQEKRWSEATHTLEHALDAAPDDPEVSYSLGMVFAQTEQADRAYTYLLRAVQLRPIYPEAMNNLAVLYLRTRRRDEAVGEFENCIRVAPAFDQSYLNLARVYAIEGDRDKARATLLELLKQHPDHTQAKAALQELK